jgi:hypothetical protein
LVGCNDKNPQKAWLKGMEKCDKIMDDANEIIEEIESYQSEGR